MKKLAALMPCWKSPELLSASIPNLLSSFTEDSKLIVILNEADEQSVNVCLDNNVEFIGLKDNIGPMAVDCAMGLFTQYEYCTNLNSDMYFVNGWDKELCDIVEKNYPATASCFLVEPYGTGNPIVQVDALGEFVDIETEKKFLKNYKDGKYKFPKPIIGYNHPIVCRVKDFFEINGYSDDFNMNFLSGYSLDNLFPWKLKKLNPDYKFIVSNTCPVYHGISLTGKKLPNEIRARNGIQEFINRTGQHWLDFNKEIGLHNPIDIN